MLQIHIASSDHYPSLDTLYMMRRRRVDVVRGNRLHLTMQPTSQLEDHTHTHTFTKQYVDLAIYRLCPIEFGPKMVGILNRWPVYRFEILIISFLLLCYIFIKQFMVNCRKKKWCAKMQYLDVPKPFVTMRVGAGAVKWR